MLTRHQLDLFVKREQQQGRHLRRAIRRLIKRNQPQNPLGRHKSIKRRYGKELLSPLQKGAASSLNAHSGTARALWFSYVASRLSRHFKKTTPPGWTTEPEVFLLSLVDHADIVRDKGGDFEVTLDRLKTLRPKFGRLLIGLNFIGMIDAALYVSARRVMGVSRFISLHGHFLVWGISSMEMKERCQWINAKIRPLLPYATAAKCSPVKQGDLPQVIWYVSKMPRLQYQLWRRRKGYSLAQFKRHINGINAVRLYRAMGAVTIPDLAMAGGEGAKVRSKVLRDLGAPE